MLPTRRIIDHQLFQPQDLQHQLLIPLLKLLYLRLIHLILGYNPLEDLIQPIEHRRPVIEIAAGVLPGGVVGDEVGDFAGERGFGDGEELLEEYI